MLNEDSNGHFEVIHKKGDDLSGSEISTGKSSGNTSTTGNLLSNVAPPIALPSFLTQPTLETCTKPKSNIDQVEIESISSLTPETCFPATNFSAAIPPSKGIQNEVDPNNLIQPPQEEESIGLFDWVRDAVANNAILNKVAEKAKSSVDSMITTLDPQMKEFIYTGGDLEILVASTQKSKVGAIKEAFQLVFGKGRIEGIEVKTENIAVQPVGFDAGIKGAEQRIEQVLKNPKLQKLFPVIAIEGFVTEVTPNRWFFLDAILLNDPIKQISLLNFTQMTPIPSEIIEVAKNDTPKDYEFSTTGFAVSVGQLMGNNLHVGPADWHKALTGIPRRDNILTAAKSLAHLYKNSIN